MIITLRHYFVDSWFGRIVAGGIFLAFVAWGSESLLLSQSGNNAVLLVGGDPVTPEKFEEAVRAELQWVATQGGDKALERFKNPNALDMLGEGTLHNLSMAMSVGQYENKVHLKATDQVVRQRVFSDSQFQGANGAFDQKRMDDLLAANHLTREDLISRTRVAAQVQAGLLGLGDSVTYYPPLMKDIVQFSTQSYPTTIIRVSPTARDLTYKGISLDDQKRFYKNHPGTFTSPELRTVHIVALTAAAAKSSVNVSDETLKKIYDERKREFDLPERRDVVVVTAPDEAVAKAAQAILLKGEAYKTIETAAPKAVVASLNEMRQTDLPDPELGKLVFGLSGATKVSAPTKMAAGWVVVKVTGVHKAEVKSFASVKSKLRDELLKYQGPQVLTEQRKKLQDEIARSSNLDGIKIAGGLIGWKGDIESGDLYPAQLPKAILADPQLLDDIVKTINKLQANVPPSLITLENGDTYAVTVDHITPAADLPFAKAQPSVALMMIDEKKHKAVETKAAALLVKARANKVTAADMANTSDVRISRWRGDLSHSGHPPAAVKQELRSQLLAAADDPETPRSVMIADGKDFVVVTFDEPVQASPEVQAQATKQLGQNLTNSLKSDISETLGTAYVSGAKLTKFNRPMFEEILNRAIKG